jgi:uncharacterized protein YjbI with pentapeptide repeats
VTAKRSSALTARGSRTKWLRASWLPGALALVTGAGCQTTDAGEAPEAVAIGLKGANMRGANVVGANARGANILGVNTRGSNTRGSNTRGSNIVGSNTRGSNTRGSNTRGSNTRGSNLAGLGLTGQSLAGQSLSGLTWAALDLGDVEQLAGTDRLRPSDSMVGLLYGSQTERDRCVLLGVDSPDFAELVTAQAPGSTLRVTLGKLPWGFAAEADGPRDLSAWQADVRDGGTRCSYVVPAPLETTWAGMAGLWKALFRWHASPAQTMEITPILASALYDGTMGASTSYTGMMDAAAKWRAGRIGDRAFEAGLSAFLAAHTNNRSVIVDFASWVVDVDGAGLVLGNVENAEPPRFAESVYYAFDKGDGTVGVSVGPASWLPARGAYAEGVESSYQSLDAAYRLYQEGLFPKPVPLRCGGTLFLHVRYGEPVMAGKCDDDVSWVMGEIGGQRGWATEAGTTAPMNGYMLLPADADSGLRRGGKLVLSETYVHMWDVNYEYGQTISSSLTREQRGLLPNSAVDTTPAHGPLSPLPPETGALDPLPAR